MTSLKKCYIILLQCMNLVLEKHLIRSCCMLTFQYDNILLGLVGRNGTGKTSFLRHMAMHAIQGIPKNCQILHVEQEVAGDDTSALQCVLNSDMERIQLLDEEARLLAQQVFSRFFPFTTCFLKRLSYWWSCFPLQTHLMCVCLVERSRV